MDTDTWPGLRVVAGDGHVERVTLGWAGRENVGEQGVERLDDMRAGGGGLGDLLGAGAAVRGEKAGDIGGEGVGDIDDDLAVQGVPYRYVLARRWRTARRGRRCPAGVVPAVATVAPSSVRRIPWL